MIFDGYDVSDNVFRSRCTWEVPARGASLLPCFVGPGVTSSQNSKRNKKIWEFEACQRKDCFKDPVIYMGGH